MEGKSGEWRSTAAADGAFAVVAFAAAAVDVHVVAAAAVASAAAAAAACFNHRKDGRAGNVDTCRSRMSVQWEKREENKRSTAAADVAHVATSDAVAAADNTRELLPPLCGSCVLRRQLFVVRHIRSNQRGNMEPGGSTVLGAECVE